MRAMVDAVMRGTGTLSLGRDDSPEDGADDDSLLGYSESEGGGLGADSLSEYEEEVSPQRLPGLL